MSPGLCSSKQDRGGSLAKQPVDLAQQVAEAPPPGTDPERSPLRPKLLPICGRSIPPPHSPLPFAIRSFGHPRNLHARPQLHDDGGQDRGVAQAAG